MTLFIGGIHRRRHPVVAVEGACTGCGRASIHLGIVAKRALHVFWIPILPLGSSKQFVCLLCGREHRVPKLTWINEAALPPSAVRSRLADLNSYYASLLETTTVEPPPVGPAPGSAPEEPVEDWDEPWDEDAIEDKDEP